MLEQIGAEARHAGEFVPKIHIAGPIKVSLFVARRNLVEHAMQGVMIEHAMALQPFQFAMDAEGRLLTRDEMEVRRPLLDHRLE